LLLLSPGIPEYLSGSSPINAVVLNPAMFLFQLTANLGLYGPGVLLIREAKVRWNKGWATVLLLGAAYGILEEGVALSTLYNSNAGPVGSLGQYGHWAGVNWVWVAGIVPFPAIFSISLPILLLGLALPSTAGTRFLPGRKLAISVFILGADVFALILVVIGASHYWMGSNIFILSFASIAVLVWLARRIPAGALRSIVPVSATNNWKFLVAGVLFFPSVILTQFLGEGADLPAVIDFLLVILVQLAFMIYVVRRVGSHGNQLALLSFSLGLISPIMVFGVVSQLVLPLVLLADLAMVIFFRRMQNGYRRPVPGQT
jgi:hypothetical protein